MLVLVGHDKRSFSLQINITKVITSIVQWGKNSSMISFLMDFKVLTDSEIKVFEKGLGYAPMQSKINELKLRNDFEEFCRKMRLKWYFPNEPTSEFSGTPSFTPKSSWKPP